MQVRSLGFPVCGACPPGKSQELDLACDGGALRELRDVGKDRHDSTLLLSSLLAKIPVRVPESRRIGTKIL